MSYDIYVRTWWAYDNAWPGGRRPHAGRKKYMYRRVECEEEARSICQQYNATYDPGELSERAEYE